MSSTLRSANGGVLPIAPAPAEAPAPAQTSADAPKTGKSKVPVEGQKVVIRRLPPGMTEEECLTLLGDEWKPGSGMVGWFSYRAGRISADPAKPSKPSRAYLHVLRSELVLALSEHVRTTLWEDAKESHTSSSLVAPPALEFSIYKKVPSSKVRHDPRQGTIDQDPEFMAFLEALANPAPAKDPEADNAAEEDEAPTAKVTTTPLVEFLREKKANKAKEAASLKAAKNARHESQVAKAKSADDPRKRSRESRADKGSDRPKETVKILTKKSQTVEAVVEAANAVASQIAGAAASEESTKRRKAGIAAAARLLQRDLGLSPGTAHRRARQEAAKTGATETKPGAPASAAAGATAASVAKESSPVEAASTPQPPTPTAAKPFAGVSARGSRGKRGGTSGEGQKIKEKKGLTEKPGESSSTAPKAPVMILKKKEEPPPAAATAPTPVEPPVPVVTIAKPPPTGPKAAVLQGAKGASGGSGSQRKGSNAAAGVVSPGATRAFVKHANPSQGVTEPLLKEAMQAFGGVTFVEIDRRKGFAYIDFADHESLVKAVMASPVTVAQATVQVLERKDTGKKAAPPAAAAAAPAPTSDAATGTTSTSGGGGEGGRRPSATAAPKTAGGSKKDNTANATNSSAAPPSASSADKAGGEHKRGGRRRGGRGRGGDGQPKNDSGNNGGSSKAAPSGNAPTTT